VIADVTAIQPTAATHLTVYQDGTTEPAVTTLNAAVSTNVDKEVVIQLSSAGKFDITNFTGSVNVTVDIEGYFWGGSGSDQLQFVAPQRICDTRSGNPSGLSGAEAQCNGVSNGGTTINAGTPLAVNVAGLASVPNNATAVIVDLTTLNESANGNLVAYAAGTVAPSTANITYLSGVATNNEATIAVGSNGQIDLGILTGTSNVLVDIVGYFATNSYTYNGDGLRMSKTILGLGGSYTTNNFTYDVTSSTPAILTDGSYSFIYGPNNLPIEQINLSSGVATWLHTDQQGSVRTITSATGSVVGTHNYGPFGSVSSTSGSVTSSLGYDGAYTDAETGFLYLINRYYSPSTGQFTSVDPLVAVTGSPYGYAGGDPVNESDPSGLCVEVFWVCIGGGQQTSSIGFRFDPGAGANATVNIGRGASFGLSDRIANFLSPGASCTVPQNRLDQSIGAAATVVATLGAGSAAEEGGAANSYIDLTSGGSIRNIGTDATNTEFADTLASNGWTSSVSQNGAVQIFQKDGAKYVLREYAESYSGWTADFTPDGSTRATLKIRLGYPG